METLKMKLLVPLFIVAVIASAVSETPLGDGMVSLSRSSGSDRSFADPLDQREDFAYNQRATPEEGSPSDKMGRFKRARGETIVMSRRANEMMKATRDLKEKWNMTMEDIMSISANGAVADSCPPGPVCRAAKYRTIDGSCNSKRAPLLGKAVTTFRRVLNPNYNDGIFSPRLAKDGSQLKSARNISMTVFGGGDISNPNFTLAVMQFGQFVNHDMQFTSQVAFANGSSIECCDGLNYLPSNLTHPACMAIYVDPADPFYAKRNIPRYCMNFVRSVIGQRNNCSLGYADQVNQNSQWLDASTVYGSDDATAASLRANFSGRLLNSTDANGRQLLPLNPSNCSSCFFAGDFRVTEHPQLTIMHTMWMREHNRIAKQLAALNPTWSDETLFQETRRIVIAQLQHITYTEWLPVLLNSTYLAQYQLLSSAPGYFTNYTSKEFNGPISNEFATAALRMGHSMVQGTIQLIDQSGALMNTSYSLSSFFNDVSPLVNDKTFFDSAIRGLLSETVNLVDRQVTGQMWNLLFRGNLSFGFDIVALNIQRGRDHGLPSYNSYRKFCGLSTLTNFSDLLADRPADVVDLIAKSYNSVDDIDLYVGGVTENVANGGTVGPTFSCLIAENFARLKRSDRFFYELAGRGHAFKPAQLTEIRKASMARIFCDNNDGTISTIQPKAFLPVSANNAPVSCSSLPAINFAAWNVPLDQQALDDPDE